MKVFCSLFDYEAAVFQCLPAVKLRLSGRTATLIAFQERVDEELDFYGLSRTFLANKYKFSLTNIGQGIKLGSTPSEETAVKIAKVLNVSVEFLVTGNDTTFSKKGIDYSKYKKYSSLIEKIDRLSDKSKTALENIIDVMEKT